MADELWNQLTHSLCQHNLCYFDLPQNEILLYGTLEELGFHSVVEEVDQSKAKGNHKERAK